MTNELPGDPRLVSEPYELAPLIELANDITPYKVEDFFKSPEETAFTVSPNGEYIAYLAPSDSKRNIFIREIGTNQSKQITNYTKRDIAAYYWLNDEELGFIVDNDGDELFRLYRTDIIGSTQRCLTPYDGTTIRIVDDLPDDPHHLIIALNKDDPRIFNLYRLNIQNAELELLEENNVDEPISSWITDDHGEVRVKIALRGGINHVIYTKPLGENEYREIVATEFTDVVSPQLIDFNDPNKLWVNSNLGRDKEVLTAIDMRNGKEIGPVIFAHNEVDVGPVSYSRKEKKLLAVRFHAAKPGRHLIDEDFKLELQTIETQLKKRPELQKQELYFDITSHDRDETRFIIRAHSDTNIGCNYLYNRDEKTMTLLAITCPWLKRDDMAPMEPIQYSSRDGLKINAYLTRPRKHNNGPIPFIMLPHGGPWARDYWGFNPIVQLFASLGFGTLQMNFRGSTGYGREFWKKSFKQWGQSMQDDVTDGVQWLIDNKLAIPDKIAIYGGSYGGYAALAGVTYTPNLYRCAIDFVGVSNLLTFLKTIPPYWQPMLNMMYEMVGNPTKDKKLLEQYSPALNADKITAPLLVVQGANDARVNIAESDQIVRNLRERDVNVLYMVKYDEGHGFVGEENRIEFNKLMIGFLLQQLR